MGRGKRRRGRRKLRGRGPKRGRRCLRRMKRQKWRARGRGQRWVRWRTQRGPVWSLRVADRGPGWQRAGRDDELRLASNETGATDLHLPPDDIKRIGDGLARSARDGPAEQLDERDLALRPVRLGEQATLFRGPEEVLAKRLIEDKVQGDVRLGREETRRGSERGKRDGENGLAHTATPLQRIKAGALSVADDEEEVRESTHAAVGMQPLYRPLRPPSSAYTFLVIPSMPREPSACTFTR